MEEKRRRECDSNSSIEHLLIGLFDLVLETRIAEACDSDVSQTSLLFYEKLNLDLKAPIQDFPDF